VHVIYYITTRLEVGIENLLMELEEMDRTVRSLTENEQNLEE
jgi:hypothetical protein